MYVYVGACESAYIGVVEVVICNAVPYIIIKTITMIVLFVNVVNSNHYENTNNDKFWCYFVPSGYHHRRHV